jgi:hypothetical protein
MTNDRLIACNRSKPKSLFLRNSQNDAIHVLKIETQQILDCLKKITV